MIIQLNNNINIRHFSSEETESKITFNPTLLDSLPQLEISIEDDEAVRVTGIFDENETKKILFHLSDYFNTEKNREMNDNAKALSLEAGGFKFNFSHTNYGDPFREGIKFEFNSEEVWISCFVNSYDARELSTFLTKLLNPS
jgi:hypothetical protein